MHLKHTTLLFCHAAHRPIATFHPHVFPLSEHGPATSDTWLERGTSRLLKSPLLNGCTKNICPMKVLKIRGTTRWNVNKSVTKRNPFLPLVEKHHVAKVTEGGYYVCFRSEHDEVRKCVHYSWQTRWIVVGGGGHFWCRKQISARRTGDRLLHSRFKRWRGV